MNNDLRLRPLRESDQAAALRAHQLLLADDFDFLFGHKPDQPWSTYVKHLDDISRGINLTPELVPATLLVAVAANQFVGRVSIRHELNDYLAKFGGHIGYAVVPDCRRQGYATEILRQSIIIARSLGVDRVLLTCDEDNTGSAKVIENCGGEFESIVEQSDSEPAKRRYWIN